MNAEHNHPGAVATLNATDRNAADRQRRNDAVLRLLDEWLADESGYDEATWPDLKHNLDQNRLSSRKLFDE